jgi:hypothetical protein
VSSLHPDGPPLSRRRLSRLLDRWAAARRLDAAQADAVRRRVLAAPVDLGFDWWWRLLDPEHGTVFQHMLPETAMFGASSPPVEPLAFGFGTGELTAWPLEDGEYQPYLRL